MKMCRTEVGHRCSSVEELDFVTSSPEGGLVSRGGALRKDG